MKKFNNASILLVNSSDYSRKVLSALLRLNGVKDVDLAFEVTDALIECEKKHYQVIIGEMLNGINDGIALSSQLRNASNNQNALTPILLVANPNAMHLIDMAREAGITDLIQAPYSADNIAERLLYALTIETPIPIDDPKNDGSFPAEKLQIAQKSWPSEEESESLTCMLLEHYLKHHEIVLAKLRFAQEATQIGLSDIKKFHQNLKKKEQDHALTPEKDLKDFDIMWERIIRMFLKGGLSEQDLFDIERIVTQIPEDIKVHYDGLTQQDKDFLTRVEALNKMGYERAKQRVFNLQLLPSPLTGKSALDYHAEPARVIPKEEKPKLIKTFFYDSVKGTQLVTDK